MQAGTLNRFVVVKLSDETGENCSATQLTKAFLNTVESVFQACHYIVVQLVERKVCRTANTKVILFKCCIKPTQPKESIAINHCVSIVLYWVKLPVDKQV